MACVSYLDADSPAHMRYTIRRMRRKLPNVQILLGCWMADVDADGSVGALTDGLLLVRHEVGMRSETLTAGALGGAAARAAAADLIAV